MIHIIDYGVGNLLSIKNILKKIGVKAMITSDLSEISQAEKLILPGVGSFDYGISSLRERGLEELLNKKVNIDKTPLLGICLGMQLLTESSEEGVEKGLGWFDAKTVRFHSSGNDLKIPHMGWSEIKIKKNSRLFENMFDENRFYFVHSFHVKTNDPQDVIATCEYGYEFDCGIEKGNIAGFQFHPEKSHKFGMKLLDNFAKNF